MVNDQLIVVLACFFLLSLYFLLRNFLIKRSKSNEKNVEEHHEPKETKSKTELSIYEKQIKNLARECKLTTDRLNTLLSIASIDCTGKSIQDQLEEIADLVSLRFRHKKARISCTISVSLPSYITRKSQNIRVCSKNHSRKSKVVISEDLLLFYKFVGKIQIHTTSNDEIKYLEGEAPFLRSISRVVSKVLTKMVSNQKLQNRLSMLQEIIDNSPTLILILKKQSVVFSNKLLKELTGWSHKDFKTKNFFDLIEIETSQIIKDIQNQEVGTFISTLKHKSGSLTRVIWDVSKINHSKSLLVGKDITKEFNLKSKTIKLQQDAFLDKMSKAVANDLNNFLTKIQNSINLLTKVEAEKVKDKVGDLSKSVSECSKLVERLLTLTKINTSDEIVDLTQTVPQIVSRIEVPSQIHVTVECQDNCTTKINENQLASVISSLIQNSIEATASRILVKVRREILPLTEIDGSLYSGVFVKLTLCDNGIGFNPNDIKEVFEPYYSTKRNLGLGLTLVRKVVSIYNGFIQISTTPKTSVSIFLPLSINESQECEIVTPLRVLVVDDEPPINEVVTTLLNRKNIDCDSTTSTREAIKKCSKTKYDIILLDLTIKDFEGSVEKFRSLLPKSKIIICSGYPDFDKYGLRYKIDGFLKKPFDVDQLLHMIRRVTNV